MDTKEPSKALNGDEVKDSKELRDQISSAITALDQELWMLDYHISENKLDKTLEKVLREDLLFIEAQIYWLKGLLKVSTIELAHKSRK